jgi:hypothetical protein
MMTLGILKTPLDDTSIVTLNTKATTKRNYYYVLMVINIHT